MTMWNSDLLDVVLRDCRTASVLSGIYALDTIPAIVQPPVALIVNLSPSYREGTHWVTLYINSRRRGFYFDPLAQPPSKPLVHFLQRNCKVYHVNDIQYQADHSLLCGMFCIVYLYFKVRNVNINSKLFTTNPTWNDQLVQEYVRKIKKQSKCKL